MEKFVEDKFDKIHKAGDFVGEFMRGLFQKTSKGFIAVGILAIFGLAIFVYGVFDGFKKGRGK